MTRRDNITRWRAKDLWTGLSRGASLLSFPSRGGLDRKVHYRGKTNATLAAYKLLCLDSIATKVTVEFLFEAVLGKTRRTEF